MTVELLPTISAGRQPKKSVTIPYVERRGRKAKTPRSERPGWARRISQAREAAGLSQTQLAERISRSQSTLGGYETGEAEPDLGTFEILADALDVSAAWLVFGDEGHESDPLASALAGLDQQNRWLALAVRRVAQLLDDEGVGGDLPFILALARKVGRAAQGLTDQTEAREAIRREIERERMELRQGLEALRKRLL